ncbi:MAG TPA: hypothetical protein VGB39_07940 [Sphingomicrobium sp.]|jgi:hypothetical protein
MLIGLPVAIALLAQAVEPAVTAPPSKSTAAQAYGPTPPPAPKPKPKVAATTAANGCRTAPPSHDATEIVVCAERPQGYRLDPDVRKAKRAMRNDVRGKPTAHMKDRTCASVGPAGCIGAGAGINLLAAALTAAQMAEKLARGESIGSMFVTDPQQSEYDLYVAARRQREAVEAEAAAKAKPPAPVKQP